MTDDDILQQAAQIQARRQHETKLRQLAQLERDRQAQVEQDRLAALARKTRLQAEYRDLIEVREYLRADPDAPRERDSCDDLRPGIHDGTIKLSQKWHSDWQQYVDGDLYVALDGTDWTDVLRDIGEGHRIRVTIAILPPDA